MQQTCIRMEIMNPFDFITKLKQEGFRITNSRRALVEIFFANKKPLTIHQITELFNKKQIAVNKTTIYRELAFLVKYGFIHELQIANNIVHYELADQLHHHHFVCNSCGKIQDIILEDEHKFFKKLLKSKNFLVDEHSLEFFGQCRNCKS